MKSFYKPQESGTVISNAPEIQPDGNLGPVSLLKAWTLIPPLVTILGHGAYTYFRYLI